MRVDPALGIIRVPRVVAAYSVGRLLNAKTGLSQLQGGIVWGVGMALFERRRIQRARRARYRRDRHPGMAGALANAVYHATGKRIRDLPITLDKVMV